MNRYVGLWQPSPAVVQIEENVTRWLCDVFDYPAGSQGLLLSGGSMANLSAMVTARHAKLGEDFLDGTYYVSEQAHASVTKAATIAGFSRRNLRIVPTDAELRMDPEALRALVREDRAAGLRPFLVAPSAGTTNTGAIDPLEAIADVAEAEGLWMHVDGAYGGFFQLTERGRSAFRGIERSDSVTLDPHKGMFLPYGTGGLVVRDGQALRDAHFEGAAYLQDLPPTGELPNYSEYSAELSRDWRGLRVWFPLRLHGVVGLPGRPRREARPRPGARAGVRGRSEHRGRAGGRSSARSPSASAATPTTNGRSSSCGASTRRSGCSCRARASVAGTCCGCASCRTARTRDRIDECIEIVAKAAAELAA